MIEIVGEIGKEPTKEELDAYMKEKEAYKKSVAAAGDRCHGCFGASFNDCQKCEESRVGDKICKTCVYNDCGICDRIGRQVKDNDYCESHRFDWRDKLLQKFIEDSKR